MCCDGIITEFNKKKRLNFARCSVLPIPQQGSQTRPYTSSTCSTPRYCKAMPLRVGMEEGPRSKAVCVSRLQYCQYS
jgi:hypothetical protein